MDEEYKQDKLVSVFSSRTICGEEIEPFCLPVSPDTTCQMVAAATNLIWWSIHEALADGKKSDAVLCSMMLLDIVGREMSDVQKEEAKALLDEVFESYQIPPEELN